MPAKTNASCSITSHQSFPSISVSSSRRMHKGRDRLSSALSGMPPLHGYESHFAVNSLFVSACLHRNQHANQNLQYLYLSLRIPSSIRKVSVIFICCVAEDYHVAVSKDVVCTILHCCGDGNSLLLLCYS